MPRPSRPPIEKSCPICDKKFQVPAYRAHILCCSVECAGKYSWKKNPNHATGFTKGHTINKERWQSKSTRAKIAQSMRNQYRSGTRERPTNEKHPGWKGSSASYSAIHWWVRRNKPKPPACEDCGKATNVLDAANISGEYRRDVNDFKYICRKCHMISDGRLEKAEWRMREDERLAHSR